MKRGSAAIIIVIVFVIAVAAAGFFIINSNSQPESKLQTTVSNNMNDSMQMADRPTDSGTFSSSEMPTGNRYVAYSPTVLADSADTRRVLFFYANWCPICKPADAEFQKRISEIPSDVTLIRVNYNDSDTDAEEQALADKYGVTYQHTFILLNKDGGKVKTWNGGGMDMLLSELQ